MRALVVDPSTEASFAFAELPGPSPGGNEVLVAVRHASLNHGDLNDARSGRLPPGAVLGSDVAGTVVQEAANGHGPAVGTPVVALVAGEFAQHCIADVKALAPIPRSVDPADAVALPVAGVAALQALRRAEVGPEQRVLVTGASGGVGRFAVQLASHFGAHVIASVGSPARRDGLAQSGAAEVVVGLEGIDRPVDVVLDNVGGPLLIGAWEILAPGGNLQSIGWASDEPAVFPAYATIGPMKTLTSFLITGDVGDDLATLVSLLEAGDLVVDSGWRGSWNEITEAADAMSKRSLRGKAVLDVDEPD